MSILNTKRLKELQDENTELKNQLHEVYEKKWTKARLEEVLKNVRSEIVSIRNERLKLSSILDDLKIEIEAKKDQKERITFKTTDIFKSIIKKENRFLTGSFFGYASTTTIGLIIWPLFLTSLNISTETIGIIVSVTAVFTLILFYFIGEKNDIESEKKAIIKRNRLYTIGWIIRIFADSTFSAFMIDAYKTVTFKLLFVPWTSFAYNVAKKKSDYFKFLISRELTFNISRIIILPILIYIFVVGFYPFTAAFLLASLLSLAYSLIIKHS